MGGSKKVTVGYNYFVGMHLVLCHGPIDRITSISVDKRRVWAGGARGGRITIESGVDYGKFFGSITLKTPGEGPAGDVDIDMGHDDQLQNDYLQSVLGDVIPAFRGVVSAVLRRVWIGKNSYMKPWAFRAQRIHVRQNGLAQWYDAKAQIGSLNDQPIALYFALDLSGSMQELASNGKTRLANMKTAMYDVLDFIEMSLSSARHPIDIHIRGFSVGGSIVRMDVDSAAIAALKSWIASSAATGVTEWDVGVSAAPEFFSSVAPDAGRYLFLLTDGNPSNWVDTAQSITNRTNAILTQILNLSVHCINIELLDTSYTAQVDNTPSDSVPIISSGDSSGLTNVIIAAMAGHLDMNPAHIIRECLTDPDWGMGYLDSDVDDDSFIAAADQLYAEQMGMSLMWQKQIPIEEFVSEILRHIDAHLYVSRRTGKFVLRLIRDDFALDEIPQLGPDEIADVASVRRSALGDVVNSITISYWDHREDVDATLSVQDTGLIQIQGATVNTAVAYPGFTNAQIAARVALRDLRALSSQLLSCQIICTRAASNLNVGDPFILHWPKLQIDGVVMRVQGLSVGDGRDNRVTIDAIEDVFALPDIAAVQPDDSSAWIDPALAEPLPVAPRAVIEAPYFALVQQIGQDQVDAALAVEPDAGYLGAAGGRPGGAMNAILQVDSGSGFTESELMDFAPAGYMASDLSETETTVVLSRARDIEDVSPGELAQLGDELVRVDSVTAGAGEVSVSLGRGVLDTVPQQHAAGTALIVWDGQLESDDTQYVAGESIDVKMLTATGSRVLESTAAPVDSVVFAARAIRPYPPANVRIAGALFPETFGANLELTWSHRDRTQQTDGALYDWTIASIGPEPGVSYLLDIYDEEDRQIVSTDTTDTSFLLSAEDEAAALRKSVSPRTGIYLNTAYKDSFDTWPFDLHLDVETLSAGPVAAWQATSVSGATARQAVDVRRPALVSGALNGMPALRFTGTESLDITDANPLIQGADRFVMLTVAQLGAISTERGGIVMATRTVDDYVRAGLYHHGYDSALEALSRTDDSANVSRTIVSGTTGVKLIVGDFHFAQGITTLKSAGAQSSITYPGSRSPETAPRHFLIGSAARPNHFVVADIGDVVMLRNPTDAMIVIAEGYLAHKFGVAAQLPSNHAFRNSPPNSAVYEHRVARLNERVRIKIETQREEYRSWQRFEHSADRAGYGFAYGNHYGG